MQREKSPFEPRISNRDFFCDKQNKTSPRGKEKTCVDMKNREKVSVSCLRADFDPSKTRFNFFVLENRNDLGLAKKFGPSEKVRK